MKTKQIYLQRPAGVYREGLKDLIACIPKDTEMVEIGCYAGESTIMFAERLKKVHAIDPFSAKSNQLEHVQPITQIEEIFNERIKKYKNINKVKKTSYAAARLVVFKDVGFVYIDGNHDNIEKDIKVWMPNIKEGGFIGGHDYDYAPIRDVVNKFKNVMTFKDSSWLVKI